MTPRRHAAHATLTLALAVLAGCSPAYLIQAASGQMAIARARRPVAEVLGDPRTSADLRRRLEGAEDALRFARSELALPDNGSYGQYVELDRPYAVWNVFAAPEFSLALRTWCFPVAGCVSYRGYFEEQRAADYAAALAARGDDVHLGGAVAYSTLGFFRDPLLSSVVRLRADAAAGLIFHELAHQRLYVAGDTVFNESFATLVEQEGTARWLEARGDRAGLCRFIAGVARERQVHRLLAGTRERLRSIYSSGAPDEARRAAKAAAIEELRDGYRQLRTHWREPPFFDAWFDGTINNASLGAVAAYDQLVGTLRVILESERGDLPAFYRRAAALARLGAADRADVLKLITSTAELRPGAECRDGPG